MRLRGRRGKTALLQSFYRYDTVSHGKLARKLSATPTFVIKSNVSLIRYRCSLAV